MQLRFLTLDVFTTVRFRGNPLAVVLIPASESPTLTHEQKQVIAREFNLSETVFIHLPPPPESRQHHPPGQQGESGPDPCDDDNNNNNNNSKSRRIDIFLPTAEIAFAGHPTIGAAVALHLLGDTHVSALITRAGPIPLTHSFPPGGDTTSGPPGSSDRSPVIRASIPHNVRLHARRIRSLDPPISHLSEDTAAAAIAALELNAPIFSICKGVSFILIELPSLELLSKVRQQPLAMLSVDELLDQGWQTGFLGRYYYVRTGSSAADHGVPVVRLRARMMEASFEDPATGSAATCLGAYLSTIADKQDTPVRRYDITQGVEMGKESNIVVDVEFHDSQLHTVKLAGTAVPVMQGHIEV